MSSQDTGSCCHASRNMQFMAEIVLSDGSCSNGITIFIFRCDISHTASAIDITNDNTGFLRDLKQQPLGACHVTLVTATVNVSYFSTLQVPPWTNLHLCSIVSSKETTNLESITARIGISRIESHLLNHAVVFCYLINTTDLDFINHLAGIVDINNCLISHCGIVTTAESIDYGATHHLQIGLGKFWFTQTLIGIWCLTVTKFIRIIIVGTITTSEELTDVYFLVVVSRYIAIHLGRDAHKSIPTLIHQIFCGFFDFFWNRLYQFTIVTNDS